MMLNEYQCEKHGVNGTTCHHLCLHLFAHRSASKKLRVQKVGCHTRQARLEVEHALALHSKCVDEFWGTDCRLVAWSSPPRE